MPETYDFEVPCYYDIVPLKSNAQEELTMAFKPLLRIIIDEETDLRIYEERHAQEVTRLVDQNRAYLRQWLPWVDNSRTVEDSRAFIRSSLQQFAQNEGFQAGIWYRGKL